MMTRLLLLTFLLLLLGASEASSRLAFAAAPKKNQHLDHRNHQVAKNPEPAPGAKHSTERLEEPGRKRNYGTEYTKEKQQSQQQQRDKDLSHRDEQGRAWTFGKVPRW